MRVVGAAVTCQQVVGCVVPQLYNFTALCLAGLKGVESLGIKVWSIRYQRCAAFKRRQRTRLLTRCLTIM